MYFIPCVHNNNMYLTNLHYYTNQLNMLDLQVNSVCYLFYGNAIIDLILIMATKFNEHTIYVTTDISYVVSGKSRVFKNLK